MKDRRERVLQQLLTIMTGAPNVVTVVRNRGGLKEEKRPAISVLDGNEATTLGAKEHRGVLVEPLYLVDMTPHIWVVMDAREPPNYQIGEDMSALRMWIVKAVFYSAELAAIIGAHGKIRYTGCDTDMTFGQPMEGQMNLRMTFTYPLLPTEL